MPVFQPINYSHSSSACCVINGTSCMCIPGICTWMFSEICICKVSFFTKEKPLDSATGTKSSHNKGILKDAVSSKANLSVHGSPLSKSGSYLGILEKSHDQNESLGFHCSFENDGSPAQEIDIPCTQPVSQDKVLDGMYIFSSLLLQYFCCSRSSQLLLYFDNSD